MKTAFSYHRYSTDMQRDSYTLEVQRSVTKKLAEKYDSKIIQIYEDEAISGATIEKRQAMLQLLEDLPKLKPDYLIATDQDRISRSNDFWIIKNELAKTKTSIITEKEGLIDQEDITKDALSDMINVFAKMERKLIGRRIKRVFDERKRKGQYIGGTPIGYYSENGHLKINELEARRVRKIFDMAYSGMSISAIIKSLYRSEIKTFKGYYFYPSHLSRILANPIYIGKVSTDEGLVKGLHKPIIDTEIFKSVNKQTQLRKLKNRTRPAKYLLTGFLKCSKCGGNLIANYGYYSYKKNDGEIVKLHGYRCKNIVNGSCFLAIIGKIDNLVIDEVRKKIMKLKFNIRDGYSKYKSNFKNKKKKKTITDEIKTIDGKMARLLESYLEGIIDLNVYSKRNRGLKNEKELLIKENSFYKPDEDISRCYRYINNFDINNSLKLLDFQAKRELLSLFINKIIIHPASGQGKHDWQKRVKITWKI